jgi:site-specific recombinase XerD
LKTEGRTTDAIVVKRASTHWLRHTAIKKITKDSGDLLLAQQLGRHSNINTTAIYGKSTLKDLSDWFRSQE